MKSRTVQATRLIGEARYKSLRGQVSKVVVKTKRSREFFRFEDGELVEYDLTRYKGKNIELSPEELDGMQKFFNEHQNIPG